MVNKFLYTGFERESLYECPQCCEPITNPLCHSCLEKGILKWLSAYPNIRKKLISPIKEYTTEVNNLVMNSINCVSCNQKKAALCPYCFTEGVYNLLKRKKVDINVIGDFLSVFNFDLKHEGYMKEAIQEEIY